MRKYAHKMIGELAGELAAGLSRLRQGYIDATEVLIQIIDPEQEYPYDFVVYRLTGYRPPARGGPKEPVLGKELRMDLVRLMLDVCDSFDLRTTDYDQKVYDTPSLAKRYHVSTKTIQRWR
ncbi:MAG: hypothetical protein KAX78_10895, partial [Phycisphaerae bacterium]|nr:hypothetical protein [Phycisphaerae bacterium]